MTVARGASSSVQIDELLLSMLIGAASRLASCGRISTAASGAFGRSGEYTEKTRREFPAEHDTDMTAGKGRSAGGRTTFPLGISRKWREREEVL